MSVSNLQELAAQFCAAIGAAVPTLQPNADGTLAFSTTIRGIDITVAHDPIAHPDEATVYVFFGSVPREREIDVLREMMNANLQMAEPRAPCFGRDDDTGRLVLKSAYRLTNASGEHLWAGLQTIIQMAIDWGQNFVLGPVHHELQNVSGLA